MLDKGDVKQAEGAVQADASVQELQAATPVQTEGIEEVDPQQERQMRLLGLLPLPTLEGEPVLHPESQLGKEHGRSTRKGDVRTGPVEWRVGVGNILTVYSHADRWDRAFGMRAYEDYKDKINDMVRHHANWCDQYTSIGMFAALSPNIDEASNFKALKGMLTMTRPIPGYPANVEKAERILAGTDPLIVLTGLKTRAFYLNILRPWDIANPVVVDAHMYSVWKLKRHGVTHVDISDKLYHQISKDFVKAAGMVDVRPNQLQATCWVVWKRRNNIVFKGHQPGLELG